MLGIATSFVFAGLGVFIASLGYPYYTWQFWVVILVVAAIYLLGRAAGDKYRS